MRERRPFLSFAIEHSLALPISAVIALAWANILPVSYTRVADALEFPLGSHTISVRATMHSIVAVEHLELVQNGKVVATVPLSADGKSASATLSLPVDRSGSA